MIKQRGLAGLLIVIVLLLVACNPKPDVDKDHKEEQWIEIVIFEKIENHISLFSEHTSLKGIDTLANYFGSPFTAEEHERILEKSNKQRITEFRLLEELEKKDIWFAPKYGDDKELLEVLKNKKIPVLATFVPSGSLEVTGIFAGYSEDKVRYWDVEKKKYQEITIASLAKSSGSNNWLKLFIPVESEQEYNEAIKDSHFYTDLGLSHAFHQGDVDLFKEMITRLENENRAEGKQYFFAYHYLLNDLQLEKITGMPWDEWSNTTDPYYLELALTYYHLQKDEEKLKNILARIQLMPDFRKETVETVLQYASEWGYSNIEKEATQWLENAKP